MRHAKADYGNARAGATPYMVMHFHVNAPFPEPARSSRAPGASGPRQDRGSLGNPFYESTLTKRTESRSFVNAPAGAQCPNVPAADARQQRNNTGSPAGLPEMRSWPTTVVPCRQSRKSNWRPDTPISAANPKIKRRAAYNCFCPSPIFGRPVTAVSAESRPDKTWPETAARALGNSGKINTLAFEFIFHFTQPNYAYDTMLSTGASTPGTTPTAPKTPKTSTPGIPLGRIRIGHPGPESGRCLGRLAAARRCSGAARRTCARRPWPSRPASKPPTRPAST